MDINAMHKLSYGLFVITAKTHRHNGCITNTVMQVTTTPNRITLAINKGYFTHDMILESGAFNVSVISESCEFSVFEHFGFKSGTDTDKFDNYVGFKLQRTV